MNKFKISIDPDNRYSTGSSVLIRDNLNNAAKKLGLYDNYGVSIFYDCCGNTHNQMADYIICPYELNFPGIILNSLGGRRMLGVSEDNANFCIGGGYPSQLVSWFPLGVDSEKFKYVYKGKNNKPFVFLVYGEANSRGNLETIIEVFCNTFGGQKDIQLYLKTRNSSLMFKCYLAGAKNINDANIIHDDSEMSQENFIELASNCDASININRSSTWDCRLLELLSLGLPIITNLWSGHKEYCNNSNCIPVSFDLVEYTDEKIWELERTYGIHNHLFPRRFHQTTPLWAEVNRDSLRDSMLLMVESSQDFRDNLSINARVKSEQFSWENSCLKLSEIINN